MLIDLDQLDDQNRQMLLEYLHQEYEKNPDQFPFPKELIEEYMLKQGGQQEAVKDIKSQEMVLEDAITGGGQQIEDEEIQEDDDDTAEYLDHHPPQLPPAKGGLKKKKVTKKQRPKSHKA
jgi:hypothetical protein